jgi:hypothetical protein
MGVLLFQAEIAMTFAISFSGLKLELQMQERTHTALLSEVNRDQNAIEITERAIDRLRDQLATLEGLPFIPS